MQTLNSYHVIIIFENGQIFLPKQGKKLTHNQKIIRNRQKEKEKSTKTVQKQQKTIDNHQ